MFWLAYNLGANKDLNIKALFLASGVSAGIFSVAKYLFVYYVLYNKNYNTIYGSFSILMFSYVWIYISWIIFLSGAYLCNFLDKQFSKKSDKP